jgi:hypothetical protein
VSGAERIERRGGGLDAVEEVDEMAFQAGRLGAVLGFYESDSRVLAARRLARRPTDIS